MSLVGYRPPEVGVSCLCGEIKMADPMGAFTTPSGHHSVRECRYVMTFVNGPLVGQTIEPEPLTPPIDYRDLLRRYIAWVIEGDGWDYLDFDGKRPFSPEECAELDRMAKEAWAKR